MQSSVTGQMKPRAGARGLGCHWNCMRLRKHALQSCATTSKHGRAAGMAVHALSRERCLPSPWTCQLHVAVAGCPPPSLAPRPALFVAPAGCWASGQGRYSIRKQSERLSGL